jgi:hypothetical protein
MRLPSLVALLAVVALGLGCTKTNPHYCPDGGYNDKDCTKPKHDAGPGDTGHVSEVGDANGANDATDVSGDLSTDAGDAAEAKPVCSDDDGCKGADAGTPACETRDGGARCVECTMNKHCGSTKPICDTTTDTCVECNGVDPTAECKDSSKSACDKAHHVCVQCVDDKTCGGTTPVCDVSTNKCRPCAADSECKDIAPGVCVDWDGHCATPTEVVTLNSSPTCVLSGQADFKFCKSIDAATALSVIPPRPVLLIQGANPVAALDLAGAVVIAT